MKISDLHNDFLKSSGICTDTRKITENCLFVALKGPNFNGNAFAQEALDKGAYKVIIDEMQYHKNTGETILHGDALKLLQKLANYHRHYLDIPIIALTGSNGKTTTKELINAVLSQKFHTTATKGNLNNHIGVPLTLLSMTKETEIGIVEMGANHIKEIERLCKIAGPDYGYITNFGKAHLEGFGSLEGVIQGKSELYKAIQSGGRLVFVNGNDLKQMELTRELERRTFGNEQQDYHIRLKDATEMLLIEYKDVSIQSNLMGAYNFHNIAAAIAIGEYFEVAPNKIKTAIERYVPENNRSQLIEKNGCSILLDAYNANPTSMMAALEHFLQQDTEKKTLLLGDMFELGEDAEKEHQHIVDFLASHPVKTAYLVGENFYNTTTDSSYIQKFKNFEDFRDEFGKSPVESLIMLVKGSRGMALERILNLL